MIRLADAISWSGRDVTLSLFVAFPTTTTLNVSTPAEAFEPSVIKQYELDDTDHHLPGRWCREYDLIYDHVPPKLESTGSAARTGDRLG